MRIVTEKASVRIAFLDQDKATESQIEAGWTPSGDIELRGSGLDRPVQLSPSAAKAAVAALSLLEV